MIKQGVRSVEKELDVARFVHTQKTVRVALKSLFTRLELFLIKSQNREFVLSSKKSRESDESNDWTPVNIHSEARSQMFNELYRGVFPLVEHGQRN